MAKEYTEKQTKFLAVLFEPGIDGDVAKAKRAAGYSENTSTSEVVASLKDEITEATRSYLVRKSPKAAVKIDTILDNPSSFGAATLLSAAKEILDRTGVVKPEKFIMDDVAAVLLLPPKDN